MCSVACPRMFGVGIGVGVGVRVSSWSATSADEGTNPGAAPYHLRTSHVARRPPSEPHPKWMRQQAELETMSYCKYQAEQGNSNIGPSTIFVSWSLLSTMPGLVEALEAFVVEYGLDADTKIWVCDFCIRQSEGKDVDVPLLGEMVAACDRTVVSGVKLCFSDINSKPPLSYSLKIQLLTLRHPFVRSYRCSLSLGTRWSRLPGTWVGLLVKNVRLSARESHEIRTAALNFGAHAHTPPPPSPILVMQFRGRQTQLPVPRVVYLRDSAHEARQQPFGGAAAQGGEEALS